MGSKLSSNRSTTSVSQAKKTQITQNQSAIKAQPVGNSLDSTAPTIKRGKERENPKKKRPSKMRKIIAAERAARLKLKELEHLGHEIANLDITNKNETSNNSDKLPVKYVANFEANLENVGSEVTTKLLKVAIFC